MIVICKAASEKSNLILLLVKKPVYDDIPQYISNTAHTLKLMKKSQAESKENSDYI